jgi:hypothetical protein
MSAFLSSYNIHSIRYGSICMPCINYVVSISRIAVVTSDGVNMSFTSNIECSSCLPDVL